MSDAQKVPFEQMALNAEEIGQLFGLSARTVLESIACRPTFPQRVGNRPATWIAGEVIAWRDANRALPKGRRRNTHEL